MYRIELRIFIVWSSFYRIIQSCLSFNYPSQSTIIYFNKFKMNIFIAGLSYGVNDADLNELFAEYGEISSAKVIMDRETGRSKGFGFVEMADDAQGQRAIDDLNGAEYDQKILVVSVARPRTERPSYEGNRNNNYNSRRY